MGEFLKRIQVAADYLTGAPVLLPRATTCDEIGLQWAEACSSGGRAVITPLDLHNFFYKHSSLVEPRQQN